MITRNRQIKTKNVGWLEQWNIDLLKQSGSPPLQVSSSLRSAAIQTHPSSWVWKWACPTWACPWSLKVKSWPNPETIEPNRQEARAVGTGPHNLTCSSSVCRPDSRSHFSASEIHINVNSSSPHRSGRSGGWMWFEERRGCQHAAVTLPTELSFFDFGARSLPTCVTLIVAMDTKHIWSLCQ